MSDRAKSKAKPRKSDYAVVHRFDLVEPVFYAIQSIHVNYDKSILVLGRDNGDVEFWETRTNFMFKCIPGVLAGLRKVCFIDNSTVVVAGLSGDVRVINTEGVIKQNFHSGGGAIWDVVHYKFRELIAFACEDGTVRIFSTESFTLEYILRQDSGSNRILSCCMSFGKNKDTVVWGSTSGRTYGWKLNFETEKRSLTTVPTYSITTESQHHPWCTIVTHNDLVLVATNVGTITLYDPLTTTSVQQIKSVDKYDFYAVVRHQDGFFCSDASGAISFYCTVEGDRSQHFYIKKKMAVDNRDVKSFQIVTNTNIWNNEVHNVIFSGGNSALLVKSKLDFFQEKTVDTTPYRCALYPFTPTNYHVVERNYIDENRKNSTQIKPWFMFVNRRYCVELWRLVRLKIHQKQYRVQKIDYKDSAILCNRTYFNIPIKGNEHKKNLPATVTITAISKDGCFAAVATDDEVSVFEIVFENSKWHLKKIGTSIKFDTTSAESILFSNKGDKIFIGTKHGHLLVYSVTALSVTYKGSLANSINLNDDSEESNDEMKTDASESTTTYTSIRTLTISDDDKWLVMGDSSHNVVGINMTTFGTENKLVRHAVPNMRGNHSALLFEPKSAKLYIITSYNWINQYDFVRRDYTSLNKNRLFTEKFRDTNDKIIGATISSQDPRSLVVYTHHTVARYKPGVGWQQLPFDPVLFASFLSSPNILVVASTSTDRLNEKLPAPVYKRVFGM
eukprot:TRINITY_DN662_c0_g1_i1.p1 TRINITY_DN662_c0_g1~~TRINITY_DN662_c0_g1_i1.p1  ORF type:complete len:730 (+),score=128.61 TRINITY_DN662_c0_g1_i1:31-2220(+)